MTNRSIDLKHFASEVKEAVIRISPYVFETPVEFSPYLSQVCDARVYLKCESVQNTGSFKIRGAANHILSLSDSERSKGIITASTGNHAAAFATVVDHLKLNGTIYLPKNASPAKLEWLKQFKVKLKLHGSDCIEAETLAKATAIQNSQAYISPYNHIKIITGQATIGLELINQLPDLQTIFCPVGGGGLASGVAAYTKQHNPQIKFIGCQPVNSKVMYESIKAGEILDLPSEPTISDGTAGGIEKDSITFEYCRQLIDDFYLVSEDEIKNAMKLLATEHQLFIEGSAALSVASLIKSGKKFSGRTIAIILTGRRVSRESISSLFSDSVST